MAFYSNIWGLGCTVKWTVYAGVYSELVFSPAPSLSLSQKSGLCTLQWTVVQGSDRKTRQQSKQNKNQLPAGAVPCWGSLHRCSRGTFAPLTERHCRRETEEECRVAQSCSGHEKKSTKAHPEHRHQTIFYVTQANIAGCIFIANQS